MGLLKGVVLAPLAPLSGLRWLAGVLAEEAERERGTRQSPERALAVWRPSGRHGEISDEDAEALERPAGRGVALPAWVKAGI